MKKILTLSILFVFITIILVGCASQGRFSVVDLDLRDSAQIEAGKNEAAVIYQNTSTNEVATPKSFDFSLLSTIISAIKGRVKVLSFEWKGNK